MDSCSLVIPTLSLPPPRIVTEGPRSSKNDQPNMNILRAESVPPKKTLSSSGTTTLSLLKPAEPAPPTLRRATSEPAKPMSRRVSLGPGCGMLDWIRLCKNSRDMAGTGGETLTVTEEELARHDTMSDAWTCIRGWSSCFLLVNKPLMGFRNNFLYYGKRKGKKTKQQSLQYDY